MAERIYGYARVSTQDQEQRKAEVLAPKKPRMTKAQKLKRVMDKAKEAGMSPEEIAAKLGVSFE